MTAESRLTSFFALTSEQQPDDGLAVERIEIPLFQRDYAQGRQTVSVEQIRIDFLDVLRDTLAGEESAPLGLDFVYGGVDEGTLRPLDGQQRLTTLYLLHWYIASRTGNLASDHAWTRFSYATRQSARMFCESLIAHPLPDETDAPSDWIKDQPWYLFLWRHDPTIQSMLVMLDAIHERFHGIDAGIAWTRLTHPENPAIHFLLLPLSGLGSNAEDMRPEDLYIKMNSRGKPLTEFENFKAHFEKTIQWSTRAPEFAVKVDTTWSDLLWNLRGDDDLIDDEFLRYMEFVTEVCEWHDGTTNGAGQRLGARTRSIFGQDNPRHEDHLEFLFAALDIWIDRSIPGTFDDIFRNDGGPEWDESKVRLFFRTESSTDAGVNLFEACCRWFGASHGQSRVRAFSLGQSLMLYAVVDHLIHGTEDLPRRLRVLRNLVEASSDELRLDRMPKILEDVHCVIRDGSVDSVGALNQAQVEDERLKTAFIETNPDLRGAVFRLEDHELLHGSLGAFEFDPESFESRASAFDLVLSQPELWSDLLAALLSLGEYQRRRTNARPFLFGTDSKRHDSAWRELLTGATRESLKPTREVLAALLDHIAPAPDDLTNTLRQIAASYIAQCEDEERFDWRYYMVKYPAIRENGSSTYFSERAKDDEPSVMGYSLCMLRAGGRALNGYYRDPYLLAITQELLDDTVVEDKWFIGYENEPRRLPLTRSGASIRCVFDGFEFSPPPAGQYVEEWAAALATLDLDGDNTVVVPQVDVDGRQVDTVDRIQLGADLIRALVAKGL